MQYEVQFVGDMPGNKGSRGCPVVSLLWCRSRKGEPYKFVPVSAFFEAYQHTQSAQAKKDLLAKPYVSRPEATDPLVCPRHCRGTITARAIT